MQLSEDELVWLAHLKICDGRVITRVALMLISTLICLRSFDAGTAPLFCDDCFSLVITRLAYKCFHDDKKAFLFSSAQVPHGRRRVLFDITSNSIGLLSQVEWRSFNTVMYYCDSPWTLQTSIVPFRPSVWNFVTTCEFLGRLQIGTASRGHVHIVVVVVA